MDNFTTFLFYGSFFHFPFPILSPTQHSPPTKEMSRSRALSQKLLMPRRALLRSLGEGAPPQQVFTQLCNLPAQGSFRRTLRRTVATGHVNGSSATC